MIKNTEFDQTHTEVFELLPWWVNKSLTKKQHERVAAHIEKCDTCRQEIHLLATLDEQIVADATQSYSNHANIDRDLKKVLKRIDSDISNTEPVSIGSNWVEKLSNFISSLLSNWSAVSAKYQWRFFSNKK